MTTATILTDRMSRVQALIQARDIDLLIATPSSDLVYLLQYPARASERPTMLAIPCLGSPFIVLPQLEAPRLIGLEGIAIIAYGETESPFLKLREAVSEGAGPARIAISDQSWSSVLLELQHAFPGASFETAGPIIRELRMKKHTDELDSLEQGAALVDRAFDTILTRRFEGRTELEIADELSHILKELGLDTAGWRPIIATGPNSASPHHLTSDRTVHHGDAVILDYGGALHGYQADTTRTVYTGPPDGEFMRVYEVVLQAQETAVGAVRPGAAAEQVDQAARDVIDAAGYGDFFIHRTGHGIGLDVHEEPYIVEGNSLRLEPGMTFSVEPGIYIPGKFGVRIEDIVAVTEDGAARLNHADRSLVSVS